MTITFQACLPDGWFIPKKDGSGKLKIEFSATEFPKIIQLSKFMDCYTNGGATFKVTIEDDKP